MLNLKYLMLLLCCILNVSIIAQESKPDATKAFLTIEPLALADPFDGASIRIGAEMKLSHQFALALTGGTYVDYMKATKINPKGYLIKPAIKYYLVKNKGLSGRYVALEYQYKNQDYDFTDTFEFDESPMKNDIRCAAK
jgi:hypothetical protein